jgi:hypothetical protein
LIREQSQRFSLWLSRIARAIHLALHRRWFVGAGVHRRWFVGAGVHRRCGGKIICRCITKLLRSKCDKSHCDKRKSDKKKWASGERFFVLKLRGT